MLIIVSVSLLSACMSASQNETVSQEFIMRHYLIFLSYILRELGIFLVYFIL